MGNPYLDLHKRAELVDRLMAARRGVRDARRSANGRAEAAARQTVDEVKRALGERGPAWWNDGAPDLNRQMARNTPYSDWFATIGSGGS